MIETAIETLSEHASFGGVALVVGQLHLGRSLLGARALGDRSVGGWSHSAVK